MKKGKTRWMTGIRVLFVILFLLILVIPLMKMNREPGKISEVENRTLAELPELFNAETGAFQAEALPQVDAWMSDNLGFRDLFLKLYANVKTRLFGLSPTDRVRIGRDGWLYYTSSNNIEIATGEYPLDEVILERIADYQQQIADYYAEQGIEYVLMLTPAKTSIYPEYLVGSQYAEITPCDILTDYLTEHTDVKVVNTKPALLAAKETSADQLFFKTDTHWTPYGCYLAYCCLMDAINPQCALANVTFHNEGETYLGDLGKMLFGNQVRPDKNYPTTDYRGVQVTDEFYDRIFNFCETKQGTAISKEKPLVYSSQSNSEGTLLLYSDSQTGYISTFGFLNYSLLMCDFLSSHYSRVVSTRLHTIDQELDDIVNPGVVVYQCSERNINYVLTQHPAILSIHAELPELPIHEAQTSKLGWIGNHGLKAAYSGSEGFSNERTVSVEGHTGILTFSGWAADFVQEMPLSALYLRVNGNTYQCAYGYSRSDVADYFHIKDLTNVGFSVSIPASCLEKDGRTEIAFYMVSADGTCLYEPEVFYLLSEVQMSEVELPNAEARGRQHSDTFSWIGNGGILPKFNGSTADENNKATIERKGAALTITGWAADFVQGQPLEALYVCVGDKAYLCDYGEERADVAEYFGSDALTNVGFSVCLPESVLPEGSETEISFVMVGAGGEYVYDPVSYAVTIEP